MNPPPISTVTPAQILRAGYEQSVRYDAPADMRERLFAAAFEAVQAEEKKAVK